MKKRVFVLSGLVVCAAATMTGCGKKATVDNVVDGMFNTKFTSANMDMDMGLDVTANIGGADYNAAANAKLVMKGSGLDGKDMVLSVDGTVDYNLAGLMQDSMDLSAYVEYVDDAMNVYVKQDDEWQVTTQEIGDILEVAETQDEETQAKIQESSKQLFKNATIEKKTQKIGNTECYVTTCTPTGAEWMEYFNAVLAVVDENGEAKAELDEALSSFESELGVSFETFLSKLPIQFTFYSAKKDFALVGLKMDFAGINVDEILSTLGLSKADLASSLGVEIGAITINKCEMSVMITDANAVTVTVPAEVKDSAVSVDVDDFSLDDDAYFDDEYEFDEEEFDEDDFGEQEIEDDELIEE